MKQTPPTVLRAEDFTRFDGKPVVATGYYEAVEQPMKGQVTKELPRDRAILRLEDGTRIYLESLDSRKSQRQAEEIRRFNGRRVQIRGIAFALMPAKGQSLIAPCLSDISQIREAE